MNASSQKILAHGFDVGASADSFGELRRSDDIVTDSGALRKRFAEDGYLYLPGFLPRAQVEAVRQQFLGTLAAQGMLDPSAPRELAVKNPQADTRFLADPVLAMEFMTKLAQSSPDLDRLLYSGPIIELFEGLFADQVRHFDFTWVRTMGKGFGTDPHCDIVYMGRGSRRVCTLWTPFSDITYEIGGLMILEGSHHRERTLRQYLCRDVDNYCGNRPEAAKIESGQIPWTWGGVLTSNPSVLQQRLGGRWLSAEYRQGDILLFGMTTVHASLDNQTPCFRISTDTRYQPASEPVDERWVGEKPVGHGRPAKRAMIC